MKQTISLDDVARNARYAAGDGFVSGQSAILQVLSMLQQECPIASVRLTVELIVAS